MLVFRDRRRQPVSAHAESDVQIELTRAIFKGLLPTVVSSGVGAVGTTMLLAHHYGDPLLWEIALIILAAVCLRIFVVLAFKVQGTHTLTPGSALSWAHAYGVSIVVYCSTLGMSTLYNFSHHDEVACNICTLGVFMFCVAVGGRMGLRPFYSHLCVLVLLAALSVSLYESHRTLVSVEIFLIVLFGYASVAAVEGKHEVLLDQLRGKRQLRALTEQDSLTGLANRRYFAERLSAACQQPVPFALLFIDLDHFKLVNDTYGHGVGDQVLKSVANTLIAAVREGDLIARLGGDEFAILQYSLTAQGSAAELAIRINQAVSVPLTINERQIMIGASVGIHISDQMGSDPDRLLSLADDALYRVKQSGRGSFALS